MARDVSETMSDTKRKQVLVNNLATID